MQSDTKCNPTNNCFTFPLCLTKRILGVIQQAPHHDTATRLPSFLIIMVIKFSLILPPLCLIRYYSCTSVHVYMQEHIDKNITQVLIYGTRHVLNVEKKTEINTKDYKLFLTSFSSSSLGSFKDVGWMSFLFSAV